MLKKFWKLWWWILWIKLMLLNRTLKMVEMTNFMLCIFCHNKKNTFCLWGSPQYCGWFESWWSEWVDSKWTSGFLAHRLEGICGIDPGVYSQWRSMWCQVRRGHLRLWPVWQRDQTRGEWHPGNLQTGLEPWSQRPEKSKDISTRHPNPSLSP